MAVHFLVIPVIMLGAGIAAFVIGGVMTMTSGISDWMPAAGTALAVCGAISAVLAAGIQVGAWAGLS